MTEHFDCIIIGSGQGGSPLAAFCAKKGWKVAIIERDQVGGTCVNYGCTPTKTMVASARVAYLNKRSEDFGVFHSPNEIKMKKILARKNEIVANSRKGSEKRLESDPNIHLFRGEASFAGKNLISIKTKETDAIQIQASKIFINTGCSAHIPSIVGIEHISYLDSGSILDLDDVPSHLIILGGSYISMEFAQIFRRLGSEVSVIERSNAILSHEDEEVSAELKKILEEDGIKFYLNSEAASLDKSADAAVIVSLKGSSEKIKGSHLLIALGRSPNTKELHVENAGLELDDKGFIKANEYLETNVEGIYAIGDVKGGPAFTSVSYDDFRILSTNLFESEKKSTKGRVVPYCVFTDPELGRTGITEKEAREQGIAIKVARMPMTSCARASEMGETRGFMKAIVDANTDKILGASILGVFGGEVSSLLHIAILGDLPYTLLRDAIIAHPTLAESLNNLFFQFEEAKK